MVIIAPTVVRQPSSDAYLRPEVEGMRNRYLLGAGVALAMAFSWGSAQAQLLVPPSGPGAWYFGGEGGWTTLDNGNGKFNVLGLAHRQSFNDGFNVGARAGYEWGPWRFEEEFRFQQNGVASVAGIATTGNRNAYAIMTNAIYDVNLGWLVTPHIGAGLGAVVLHDGWGIRNIG